jgi:Family of unknown function (DUF6134)
MMDRRFQLLACALIAPILIGAAPRAPQLEARYAVSWDGKRIGSHDVALYDNGQSYDAHVAMNLNARYAFVKVKIKTNSVEQWSDQGDLLRMESRTQRSEKQADVQATRLANGTYRLIVNGAESQIEGPLFPTSFTFAPQALMAQDRSVVLLDILNGKQRESHVDSRGAQTLQINGQAIPVQTYEVTNLKTGDMTHKLWLDRNNRVVKMSALTKYGIRIDFVRETMSGTAI